MGLSCASDASFQLEYFDDYYCLTRTGTTHDDLQYFNKDMSELNCINIYGKSNSKGDGDGSGALIQYLIGISDSCSSYDTGLCMDSYAASERHGYVGKASSVGMFHHTARSGQSWFTKLKYVTGGLLLLASFVMFTGILFTNRRRRRALMQRKYRQAKRSARSSSDSRSRRSGRSASKHRDSGSRGDGSSRKSSSRSRRSKSRDPRARESPKRSRESRIKSGGNGDREGVMT